MNALTTHKSVLPGYVIQSCQFISQWHCNTLLTQIGVSQQPMSTLSETGHTLIDIWSQLKGEYTFKLILLLADLLIHLYIIQFPTE